MKDTFLGVGLLENVVSFSNSPDFGLRLGFAHRFRASPAGRPHIPEPPGPVFPPAE